MFHRHLTFWGVLLGTLFGSAGINQGHGTFMGSDLGNANDHKPAIVAAHLLRQPKLVSEDLFSSTQGQAPVHSASPVNITTGISPRPIVADGQVRLLYELYLTNFSPIPLELLQLDVLGTEGSSLASYRAESLENLVMPVGLKDSENKTRAIGGGRSAVIFLDLTLKSGINLPLQLQHRLSLSIPQKNGGVKTDIVQGSIIDVIQGPAPVLRPPLRGSGWVAGNAFSGTDHRRALVAVDGKARIAQRFAIDWMRLGSDGRLFHGDARSNANFYGYGAEVVAVGDGRIVDLKDGLPDNIGINERSDRHITLDNVVGNYVTIDLGHGRFALYAHLQPGTIQVKRGDTVKTGQVLAKLGNSGNSDAPHLHFQLTDANSPLGSEGIPYGFEAFTQFGVIDLAESLTSERAWQPKAAPVTHRHDFPLNNAVVTFP